MLGCQSVALRVGAAAATVDPCCNEGEEPDDFFDALGGKAEYFSSPALEVWFCSIFNLYAGHLVVDLLVLLKRH